MGVVSKETLSKQGIWRLGAMARSAIWVSFIAAINWVRLIGQDSSLMTVARIGVLSMSITGS